MNLKVLDTPRMSASHRKRAIDVASRRLLITNYSGSLQADDLTEPPNCGGVGRVRHFKRDYGAAWPPNPLPLDPALKALGAGASEALHAQVFQNAVCNWRCWYCYVDFALLKGSEARGEWLTAGDLVDRYLNEPNRPRVIDLTGGQPDLTPEWVPWMMEALRDRHLSENTYLWSDDNLSNDYLWRYLVPRDLRLLREYKQYGRVCCFKGFSAESFHFNTCAEPSLFSEQFNLFARLMELGIDLYAYVTITCDNTTQIENHISDFVDRLQRLHPLLPLRTVPLRIDVFGPVKSRLNPARRRALENQHVVVALWQQELESRYSSRERAMPITHVELVSSLA